jgi:hypothetical protein
VLAGRLDGARAQPVLRVGHLRRDLLHGAIQLRVLARSRLLVASLPSRTRTVRNAAPSCGLGVGGGRRRRDDRGDDLGDERRQHEARTESTVRRQVRRAGGGSVPVQVGHLRHALPAGPAPARLLG